MQTQTKQHVVILGGGYGGQLAAARLTQKRLPIRITVVDASPVFVERIRLHQTATGQPVPLRPMPTMLPSGVEFRQARVIGIDPQAKTIALETPTPEIMSYDWLIYALGSTVDKQSVPGVREHALALSGPPEAQQLHTVLSSQPNQRVLVVGGGLTGIEAVTEMAELYPGHQVTLLTGGIFGADLSPNGAAYVREVFTRLGIQLIENMRVNGLEAGQAQLANGTSLPFDVCVWASGFRVPDLARESGLPVNRQGQLLTDPDLRVSGFPSILGVGDAAEAFTSSGQPLRMACATALPMAAQAAETLTRLIQGETPTPFRFGYVFRCISLGRADGLIQFVDADDRPTSRIWTGRVGAWVKEMICRYPVKLISMERDLGLPAYQWPQPRLTMDDRRWTADGKPLTANR